jgi:hypothetical protein
MSEKLDPLMGYPDLRKHLFSRPPSAFSDEQLYELRDAIWRHGDMYEIEQSYGALVTEILSRQDDSAAKRSEYIALAALVASLASLIISIVK